MTTTTTTPHPTPVPGWDWPALAASLDEHGHAVTPPVFSVEQCAELTALYDRPEPWRSRVDMARYGFGSGEYKYFAYPLPEVVAELRAACYPRLAPIANAWQEKLGLAERFPSGLNEFLATCHTAGQTRPTPLLLRYRKGDHNCLHQDIYGEHAFPFQVMVMLSQHSEDYMGGEFLLVENRPRAQSFGRAVTLDRGQAVIWPTRYRPRRSTRGYQRVAIRHGVSPLRTGSRHALGVIFHDAA
jgi:hypothetical protein